MRIVAVALLTAVIPIIATAQGVVRDVAYYTAHPAEAAATAQVCRDHPVYSRLAACQAAIRALTPVNPNRTIHSTGRVNERLFDPSYWSANRFDRAITAYQCQRRAPEDQPFLQYCSAVAASIQAEQAR